MTESEARTKPISEVWAILQNEESKAAKHWADYEKTGSDSKLIWHTKARANVHTLRAVLLERC